MEERKTLVIAGASGFIGRWFIKKYKHKYRIIALSRKKVKHNPDPDVEWRQVELYSISSTERALQGANYALYLVHSMSPSARLDQGNFEDTDLILADNFARAAEKHRLEQIIYMGGILPKESENYSRHLRSRLEVEQTLSARKTPVTTFRAGIIIGPGGSSFRIVERLVKNLPVMACPKWCESKSQPIAVSDTLKIIDHAFGHKKVYGKAIEIGGFETLSYMDLLKLTARKMGKKRLIFSIPVYTVGFSKLWVARFTSSSTTFVSPLVESLRHKMTVDRSNLLHDFPQPEKSMDQTVREALERKDEIYALPSFERQAKAEREKNTVRSYQRLENPRKIPVHRVARLYQSWLPKFFNNIVQARPQGNTIEFRILNYQKPILKLQLIPKQSYSGRHLFYITGGSLVKRKNYGWLEFRSVLNDRYIIAAIHEFIPRLPWYIYTSTQAKVHLWVMNNFGKYLKSL